MKGPGTGQGGPLGCRQGGVARADSREAGTAYVGGGSTCTRGTGYGRGVCVVIMTVSHIEYDYVYLIMTMYISL